MTNTAMGFLREVQKLDDRIREMEEEIASYDPLLEGVEAPALELESELSQVQERLGQMKSDARRLERAADDKRSRAARLDERLNRVSNLREEAAVRTELDLTRKALEADEQEALQLIESIQKTELAADELEASARAAREEVAPRKEALLDEQARLRERVEALQGRRDSVLESVGERERKVYEAFHQSGRAVVVSGLLDDGACGNCFGMIPLQLQNEIREGSDLIRCEACGVILTDEPELLGDADVEGGSPPSAEVEGAAGAGPSQGDPEDERE